MRPPIPLLVAALATLSGCSGVVRATATTAHRAQAVEIPEGPAGTVVPEAIPAPDNSPSEPEDGVVHIVQPGQTLWRIARAYDIPLDRLAETNGIDDPSRVDVGTPLFVPGVRATMVVAPFPAPVPSPAARLGPAVPPHASADFLWPIDGGAFMRPFGEKRRRHTHAGVDIRGALGQDILAAKDGVVTFSGVTTTGYGAMVVLDHGDGVQTLYAHAQKVLVRSGESVRRGQPIALVGRTGNATTEHCHFEVRLENRAVDPMSYLLGTTEARR